MTTTALLVIDMQLVAFDGQITPPIADGVRLLDNIERLIGTCRNSLIKPIFVQTCAVSGQPYARDAHGWEIHPRLSRLSQDRVVYKRNSSAFDDTPLKDILDELEVNALVICGIWSEYCVARTSTDAVTLGFDVYVASDAHGTASRDTEAKGAVASRQNDRLSRLGATVLTIDEVRKRFARD